MIDQAVSKFFGHLALETLDFLILKFYHFSTANIDQVIVMLVAGFFVARPTMAKIMAFKHLGFLEQANCPINRRQADSRVELGGPPIHRVGVRMVVRFRQHLRDNAPLIGHFQALFQG